MRIDTSAGLGKDVRLEGVIIESRFHLGSDDFSNNFVYHYTSATSMHKILHASTFRFGRLSQCNDPRERKVMFGRWSIEGDPPGEVTPAEWDRFEFEIEKYLLHSAYVGCFTLDSKDYTDHGHFARGFGRARSWDQYGEKHRGACLVFERVKLEERVSEWVANHPGCESMARFGCVEYIDKPVEAGDERALGYNFSPKSILTVGPRRRARRMWDEDFDALYLQKATDWGAEREYRIVVHCECDAPPTVDIRGCLLSVVVGEEYGVEDEGLLRERLRRSQLMPITPARMRWTAGAPYADLMAETEPRTDAGSVGPYHAWWD